jgi:predicted DNA-binding protein
MRIPTELKERAKAEAERQRRSAANLAVLAIEQYLERVSTGAPVAEPSLPVVVTK